MATVRKPLVLFIILCLTGLLILAFVFRETAGREILEFTVNQNTQPFFSNSIEIGGFHLDPTGRLELGDITGALKTSRGLLALEIRELVSQDPLIKYFSKDGVTFHFQGVKPGKSTSLGVTGKIKVKGGKDGFYQLDAVIVSLTLEEMRWLEPENLKGATGTMTGNISVRQDARGEPQFLAQIHVREPGGQIAVHLFDRLLPYLPQMAESVKEKRKTNSQETVSYREAKLKIEMAQLDQMKIFLHMQIPDYNLNLNLNIDVRIDEKNGFFQLAQLMGLVKKE